MLFEPEFGEVIKDAIEVVEDLSQVPYIPDKNPFACKVGEILKVEIWDDHGQVLEVITDPDKIKETMEEGGIFHYIFVYEDPELIDDSNVLMYIYIPVDVPVF